jgi:hypothetical protein
MRATDIPSYTTQGNERPQNTLSCKKCNNYYQRIDNPKIKQRSRINNSKLALLTK